MAALPMVSVYSMAPAIMIWNRILFDSIAAFYRWSLLERWYTEEIFIINNSTIVHSSNFVNGKLSSLSLSFFSIELSNFYWFIIVQLSYIIQYNHIFIYNISYVYEESFKIETPKIKNAWCIGNFSTFIIDKTSLKCVSISEFTSD